MAIPVAVAYISVPAWRYWDDGHWPEEWPADPLAMKVYYLYADGHFELQATTTFTTGPAGYDNRYGYDASTPGTIGDTDYEPETVIGEGEPRCYIEWSPSLDAEAIYDTEEDALLDFNPRRIRREEAGNYDQTGAWIPGELPPPPPWRYNSWALRVINGPSAPQRWWTDKTGTIETSDKTLHKVSSVRVTPAVMAQPYQPPMPARTVVFRERVCWYEPGTGGWSGWSDPFLVREINLVTGEVTYIMARVPIGELASPARKVCETRITTQYIPATPAVPAVAYRPPVIDVEFGMGWDAAGHSVAVLLGNGYVEFRTEDVTGVVAGLTPMEEAAGVDWRAISHGFYVAADGVYVVEHGERKYALGVSSSVPATYRVEREGGVVSYLREGVQVYVSDSPSVGPAVLDAALYGAGISFDTGRSVASDEVQDAPVVPGDHVRQPVVEATEETGAVYLQLLPARLIAAEDETYAGVLLESAPVEVLALEIDPDAVMLASRTALVLAHEYEGGGVHLEARPATVHAEQGLPTPGNVLLYAHPAVAWSEGTMMGIGDVQLDIAPPAMCRASDAPEYGDARLSLMPVVAQASDVEAPIDQWPLVPLPRCRLLLTGPARVEMTAPRMKLQLLGAVTPLDAVALPSPMLALVAGAHLAMSAPRLQLHVEATVTAIGRIEMTAPAARLSVEAAVETLAELRMAAPRATLAVSGGAQIAMASPRPTLTMAATMEGRAEIALAMPRAVLVLEARGETTGQIVMLAPATRGAVWADAILTMPLARLRIEASALVPVQHEAYAVNLRSTLENGGNEITRYTGFPFNRIVRWRGEYWAIAPGGLYRIGGSDDDGAPIAWVLRTGTTDFDSPLCKTPAYCYVGGRLGPACTFTVFTGELRQDAYTYHTPRGQTAQNYRQQFGRGLNARYYAFEVSGNGELAIDDLDFKIDLRTRRI